MRSLILFVTLLLMTNAIASDYKMISSFASSLNRYLLLETEHFKDIVKPISIKKPTAFQRWQMEKSGAEATYNDITNTIVLKDDYFKNESNSYRVIGLDDLAVNNRYSFFVFASTTFHELTHADFDVTIEGSNSAIRNLLENKIKPWFSKKLPGVNSKIATHEMFGYTAGDSLFFLSQRMSDVMMNHGIRYPDLTCFPKTALEKIGKRLGYESGIIEFKNNYDNSEFYLKTVPDYVFVKGKEIDVKKIGFPEEYKKELYNYFVDTYGFPNDFEELIYKLNDSKVYREKLVECYKDIF